MFAYIGNIFLEVHYMAQTFVDTCPSHVFFVVLPKTLATVGSTQLYRMYLYAVALRVPFSGIKRPKSVSACQ